jgi:hypothetical protein
MRVFLFLVLTINASFAQSSLRDVLTGRSLDNLTITELSRDASGVTVKVDGMLDGQVISKVVVVNSPVTRVTLPGRTVELFYQRPLPSVFSGNSTVVKPATQFSRELAGSMMDRIVIRKYNEQKEADRLGFDNINKMKQFSGQNRTKISQASKSGSADPLGDVLAAADAKRSYRASAEQQDPDVRSAYSDIRMQMQGAFQKAQEPIYSKQSSASDSEQQGFASVCQGIEELRKRFVGGNRRVLRSGDMTVDLGTQGEFSRGLEFLRSTKVKTEPPYGRPDINDAQKVVDKLKVLMSLPLSN